MSAAAAGSDEAVWAVVVDTIGSATAHHISALTRVLRRPAGDVAACVLRAPAPLIDGLDTATARGLCHELEQAGLTVRVCASDALPVPDRRRFDLALRVPRVEAVDTAFRELMGFLGATPEAARDLLLREPAVFLGGVTGATADALAARFAGHGIELDASNIELARYDVFADADDRAARARVIAALRDADVATRSNGQPLVASDLDHAAAGRAAQALERCRGAARVLNRDFYWFDVQLVTASDGPGLREVLARDVGIPEHAVGRLVGRLPLVLRSQVKWADAERLLARLAEVGARAEATLLVTRRFALRLRRIGDGRATDRILAWLGKVPAGDRTRLVRGTVTEVAGPFSLLQARWLRRDLAAVGTDAELVTR